MTDSTDNTNNHRDHEHDLRDALAGASRDGLRKAASDGEPGAQDALDALGGDSDADHRAVHNETALRHAVGRVMGSTSMPEHLRLRIVAAMSDEQRSSMDALDTSDDSMRIGTETAAAAGSTVEQKPTGVNGVLARLGRPLAAAAVLALGGIAVFQGIQNANPSGGQTASVLPSGQIQELVSYLTGRHGGATAGTIESSPATAVESLTMIEDAVGDLTPALSTGVVRIADAGYSFRIVATCEVPNAIRSAHITLTPPASAGSAEPVSVFVQSHGPDAESCLLKQIDGESCYTCPNVRADGRTFAFWLDGNLVVHVLGDSEQSFEELLAVLQAPSVRVDVR